MSAVERCERSDLPIAWCAHCKGLDLEPGQRPDETITRPRESTSFFVRCSDCQRALIEGEQVMWAGIKPYCLVCVSGRTSDT